MNKDKINKEKENNGLGLSLREQKRIFKDAAEEANKAQRELVERYERKFGKPEQKQVVCSPAK